MIAIRRLEEQDRGPWERLFREYIRFYNRTEPQALYDRAWNEFMRDERMHARVAELNGIVVGIVHFLVHVNTTSADVCYLQDLYTDEASRRQGVARALIQAVADEARIRQCSRVYWMTQETNTTARRLYDQVAEYGGFIRYQMQLAP